MLDLKEFTFINNFAAKGYGICNLSLQDRDKLDQVAPQENAPIVVMGPDHGIGFCYLTKD